jgi:hypothetical protein
MRKTTITIPAIEMSKEEEIELWHDLFIKGNQSHDILDWDTSDGENQILFVGENAYRKVVRKGN